MRTNTTSRSKYVFLVVQSLYENDIIIYRYALCKSKIDAKVFVLYLIHVSW